MQNHYEKKLNCQHFIFYAKTIKIIQDKKYSAQVKTPYCGFLVPPIRAQSCFIVLGQNISVFCLHNEFHKIVKFMFSQSFKVIFTHNTSIHLLLCTYCMYDILHDIMYLLHIYINPSVSYEMIIQNSNLFLYES